MDEDRHYTRAPIVEAIIEFQFEAAITDREFERIQNQFKGHYPTIEERQDIEVSLRGKDVATSSILSGFKMTAKNAMDIVLVSRKSFASTHLTPYDRWETFQATAKENFEQFTKICGRKTITRIGVRYLNRIDIPLKELDLQPMHKFITVGVAVPTAITEVIGNFSLALNGIEASTGANFLMQCGMHPPVLIGHGSIALDIDVYWEKDQVPGRVDEVWARTDVLRKAKNSIFELSITDETRALIK